MVEAPPGGPLDVEPPRLLASVPDSGATGVGGITTLRFTFSEKMDRQPATGWLTFFPPQRIRGTKWHGALEAEVRLEAPLPPDTTVVVELGTRLSDSHKVRTRAPRRFPIATGDTIFGGAIAGVLVMGDSAVTRGVVELYALPPDSLTLDDMPLLRRTNTDRTGAFLLSWLPVPGGPYRLRAFVDGDGDQRAGSQEARRVLPDTLVLSPAAPAAAAAVATLYSPDTPGRLLVRPFAAFGDTVPTVFFTQWAGEADTAWTPRPLPRGGANFKVLTPRTGGAVDKVRAGANHLAAFVDVDLDTAFGAVAAELVRAVAGAAAWTVSDSLGDTTGWYLEPLVLVPAPAVEAGLDTWFSLPDTLPVLVPWSAPPPAPAAADSAAGAPAAADPTPRKGK